MPDDDTPVLDTLAAMTAASLERCDLPSDTLLLIRLAALVAVDARPVSYLAHIGAGRRRASRSKTPRTSSSRSLRSSEQPGSCPLRSTSPKHSVLLSRRSRTTPSRAWHVDGVQAGSRGDRRRRGQTLPATDRRHDASTWSCGHFRFGSASALIRRWSEPRSKPSLRHTWTHAFVSSSRSWSKPTCTRRRSDRRRSRESGLEDSSHRACRGDEVTALAVVMESGRFVTVVLTERVMEPTPIRYGSRSPCVRNVPMSPNADALGHAVRADEADW